MNTWLRGSLCSRVKPCGAMSLSNNGDTPRAVAFSSLAPDSWLTVANELNCSWWQVAQAAWSVRVPMDWLMPSALPFLARWFSAPVWQ